MYKAIFCSGGNVEEFLPDTTAPATEREGEYKLLLRVIAEIGTAYTRPSGPAPYFYGKINHEFLQNRFLNCGKELIREKQPDHFPDCTIVTNQLILIIDHFRVDGSEPIVSKRGKHKGTRYQQFLGDWRRDEKDMDMRALEEALQESGITFSSLNLVASIKHSFNLKAPKLPSYSEAICQHIQAVNPPELAAIDLAKTTEVWFLIEDISPSTDFASVSGTLTDLLQKNQAVAGIIYVHNPLAPVMPLGPSSVALINNDDIAHKQLRKLAAQKRSQALVLHAALRHSNCCSKF